MFEGKAEEAMNLYTSLFEHSEIANITRYGVNEPGPEGSIKRATFTLNGTEYMCIDSAVKHDFTFTPAISIFVTCDTENEIDELYGQLSMGGKVLMPLAPYPFSPKFAWITDRFGVSWQMGLMNKTS